MDKINNINTEQATWLYQIRDNDNFHKSLAEADRILIVNILNNRQYYHGQLNSINRIRKQWIRYVKLNNNKDI